MIKLKVTNWGNEITERTYLIDKSIKSVDNLIKRARGRLNENGDWKIEQYDSLSNGSFFLLDSIYCEDMPNIAKLDKYLVKTEVR